MVVKLLTLKIVDLLGMSHRCTVALQIIAMNGTDASGATAVIENVKLPRIQNEKVPYLSKPQFWNYVTLYLNVAHSLSIFVSKQENCKKLKCRYFSTTSNVSDPLNF
jgi:hypothetical protein